MVRKLVLLAVTAFTALAVIPVAAANSGPPRYAALQTETSEEDTQATSVQVTAEELDLGQRYVGAALAFEAQDAKLYRSLDRHNYLDVRVSVALRNDGARALPYSPTALAGEPGYPQLQLVDDEGVVYPLDRTKAQAHAVPGSNLQSIPVGLPAHWTVGFEVPQTQADDLTLELVSDGAVVARWDLYSEPAALQGWTAPDYASVASVGEDIPWEGDLSVTILDRAADACGAADLVVSAGTGVVLVTLNNDGVVDAPFPNVLYPSVTGIAVWADGTTGRFSDDVDATAAFVDIETLVEGASTAKPEVQEGIIADLADLDYSSRERKFVTPAESAYRGLLFPAPRDSRLVDPVEPPDAVVFYTPDGDTVWVDLTSLPGDEYDMPVCTWTQPSMFLGTIESPVTYQELVEVVEEDEGVLGP